MATEQDEFLTYKTFFSLPLFLMKRKMASFYVQKFDIYNLGEKTGIYLA